MQSLRTIPILGTKNDVPPDDPTMLQVIGDGVVLTHDAGGVNFDLGRKKNTCTKCYGVAQWSNSATAAKTKANNTTQTEKKLTAAAFL